VPASLIIRPSFSASYWKKTTLSVIAASTSGLNVQKEHKKYLIAMKIGLPLKRLSTVKRVLTQIFTSEKSCWTFIGRKTRNDCISDEIRKLAYNFWIDPNNSRPSGNKNDMKRVRIDPQSVATVISVRCSYTWYISLSSSEILGIVYFFLNSIDFKIWPLHGTKSNR
jgi:hypothetical protein